MQRRHKEEQWLQAWLEEAAETYHVKYATQKARKVAKTKVRKEAKK